MTNGDYADRARTARVRDRATWVVAALSTVATTGTVVATLGLAAVLPVPAPEPATAPPAGPAAPSPSSSRAAPVPSGIPNPESAPADVQALNAPDRTPTERRRSSKPARSRQQQDAPRTSGS